MSDSRAHLDSHHIGAAVPAAETGVSPAKTNAGETPVQTGEDACPTMRHPNGGTVKMRPSQPNNTKA